MNTFESRYKKLNPEQRQAVDTIDGPLIVIAGPGTGKTELLSMRAANILRKTDTLPENILCLTFTDSGATAMRARLADIIGPDAYKVAIQTFHSFGTEVINQNSQYFYHGASFKPADELSSYEILTGIFDELDHANPLASKMSGEYTYLRDSMSAISDLKQAGLSSDELLAVINANETVLDTVEKELSNIFAGRVSTTMLTLLAPIAERVAALPMSQLPSAIDPLSTSLALSMARAFDAAVSSNKTTPITAWRNEWMEKDSTGTFVFKDRKRHTKLRALAHVYFAYLNRMEQAGLYDYDDMVLNVVHGMELYPDLKYNLQERYHYIMVDEFQDTNLAQMRILFNLTENPVGDAPNIMAVGDDDQAIYSFQGADVNNIHRFRQEYPGYKSVVLIHNYRSAAPILAAAREVITQASGRLEATMDISKQLVAHSEVNAAVDITVAPSRSDESAHVATDIARRIAAGTAPSDIAIIARRHSELLALLPYLHQQGIAVNYERRDNVLDLESILTLELFAQVAVALSQSAHDVADSLLPELISHPMFAFTPEQIWKLSVTSYRNHLSWMETMTTMTEFKPLAEWLLTRSAAVTHEPLEEFIDQLVGPPARVSESEQPTYHSPYYEWYFSQQILDATPESYLITLEALRTIRTKLREYRPNETPHIADFLEFIAMHRQLGSTITSVRASSVHLDGAINLMTAHKSKGLEFDTVYIVDSVDSMWGERVRSRSRLISYPSNLSIAPNADTYDERLRLYYVGMTRAKRELHLTFASTDDNGKDMLQAGFLTGTTIATHTADDSASVETRTSQAELAWHDRITDQPTATMKSLLQPSLEHYKLSSTHLNNFIDLTRGGPRGFLMNNLLRFPQAKSANASYGTAVHAALQRAHNHLIATGERRPVEDVLGDFTQELHDQHLDEADFETFRKRGSDALTSFLAAKYDTFTQTQKTELSFAGQGVVIGDARLTGNMDLVDINDNHLIVTDYKTGKPSTSWTGKSEYEKIKLHKYKQQLMFYQLLARHSRNYAKYEFEGGVLQFVEPDTHGDIHSLEEHFSEEELERFAKLIQAIWHSIMTLDFPDTSEFAPTYKGILAFEDYLVDKK